MRDYIIQCDSLTTWPALIVFSLLRASFMGQSMPVSVAIISRYARFVDCGQSVAFSDGLPLLPSRIPAVSVNTSPPPPLSCRGSGLTNGTTKIVL